MKKSVIYTVENLELGYKTEVERKISISETSDEMKTLFTLKHRIASQINKTYEEFLLHEAQWNMNSHCIEILSGEKVAYRISNLRFI